MLLELFISGHLLRVEEDEVGKDAPLGDGGQVESQLGAGGLGVGNVARPHWLGHGGLGGPLLDQPQQQEVGAFQCLINLTLTAPEWRVCYRWRGQSAGGGLEWGLRFVWGHEAAAGARPGPAAWEAGHRRPGLGQSGRWSQGGRRRRETRANTEIYKLNFLSTTIQVSSSNLSTPCLTMMLIFMSATSEGLDGTEEGQSVVFVLSTGHWTPRQCRDINTRGPLACSEPVKCFHAH